ncbi:hypothetical protein [Photobacterium damselae]
MKKLLLCVFLIFPFNVNAQEYFFNKLPLSVKIERSKFFDFGLKNVYFEEDEIKVDFDFDRQKFEDAQTNLHIETDIPSSWNFPYILNVVDISDSCHSRSDPTDIYITGISDFYINGEKLDKATELSFKSFNSSKDFLFDIHRLDVKFKKLDPEIYSKSKCTGTVVINVGIDF